MSDGASEMGKMKAAHEKDECWPHCYFCKQETKKKSPPRPVRGWWQREDK